MAEVKQGIKSVDKLLKVLNERREGYRNAAENVNNPDLINKFGGYARQAQEFAQELVPFSSFDKPQDAGTRPHGDAFRGWMDLKSAVSNGGTDAMISASVTGEKAAISGYENSLSDEEVKGELAEILNRHLAEIRAAHDELKKSQ